MGSTSSGEAGTALVVDDEAGVRLLLQHALTRSGFDVHTVDSAEAGLQQLESRKFDLLLTDKNMPGMDGVELAQRARAMYPDLCIVMVTGYASEESAEQTVGVIDAYLTKPFSVRDLRDKLLALLERARARNAAPKVAEPSGPVTLPADIALLCPTPADRDRLESVAKQAGVALRLASDASAIGELPPGSVLLVDGVCCTADVYRAIWRRQAQDRRFGVVLVTSPNDSYAAINAVSLGAQARLTLPVSTEAFIDALRRHGGPTA